MQKRHIYFFLGTTAELIKIAPIIKELKKRGVKFKIITSGQNKILFENLSNFTIPLKADISFKEKVNKSSTLHFIFWAIRTFFSALFTLHKEFKNLNKNNSYFIIYGDPVSSSMGAVISTIYRLKLVHVESGDLSFNLLEPFPEEICRNINIYLADILFPPNQWAKNNLEIKNVRGTKINTYHNTLVESFWWAMKTERTTLNPEKFKKYYILILHRQEHVLFRKNWSKNILEYIISNADQDLNCLLFNHPLTANIIKSLKLNPNIRRNKIKIMPLVSYLDFLKLMRNAEFIASDGATNQLEAYLMGKPCLVLRDFIEQTEGVGKNVVLCKSDAGIMKEFLQNYNKYETKPIKPNIKPSKIIVDYLMSH